MVRSKESGVRSQESGVRKENEKRRMKKVFLLPVPCSLFPGQLRIALFSQIL
jgi:hypothetical protein